MAHGICGCGGISGGNVNDLLCPLLFSTCGFNVGFTEQRSNAASDGASHGRQYCLCYSPNVDVPFLILSIRKSEFNTCENRLVWIHRTQIHTIISVSVCPSSASTKKLLLFEGFLIYRSSGIFHCKLQSYKTAIKVFFEEKDRRTDVSHIYRNLAHAYKSLDRTEDAINSLLQCLEFAKNSSLGLPLDEESSSETSQGRQNAPSCWRACAVHSKLRQRVQRKLRRTSII